MRKIPQNVGFQVLQMELTLVRLQLEYTTAPDQQAEETDEANISTEQCFEKTHTWLPQANVDQEREKSDQFASCQGSQAYRGLVIEPTAFTAKKQIRTKSATVQQIGIRARAEVCRFRVSPRTVADFQ